MKIFTTDGIRRIEEKTIERDNLSRLDLMERAAEAVTYEIVSRWRTNKHIIIFSGPGDNGGDGLACRLYVLPSRRAPVETGALASVLTDNDAVKLKVMSVYILNKIFKVHVFSISVPPLA